VLSGYGSPHLTSPDVPPATPVVAGARLSLEVIEWMAALTGSST